MELFQRMKKHHIENVRISDEEWRKEYGNTYNTIGINATDQEKIAFAEDIISIYLLREAEKAGRFE